MFGFLYPEMLWMLLLPTLAFFFLLSRNKNPIERVFTREMLERLKINDRAMGRKTRNALFLAALACMVTAIARPVIERESIQVESKGYDIVIAIDMSASMLARDIYPSRLDVALSKAKEIALKTEGSRVGVIGFSKNAFVISPLTRDSESLVYMLDNLNRDGIKIGSTQYTSALGAADLLLSSSENKAVILLTDGGDGESFEDPVEFAADKNMRVYVIGIGTEKGAPIQQKGELIKDEEGNIVVVRLNENVKELAIKSGGAYTVATLSDEDSIAILQDIRQHVEKTKYGSGTVKDYQELFVYPLLLAVLFMLIGFHSLPRAGRAAFVLILLLPFYARAGLLDFRILDQAEKAYERGDYGEAARQYEMLRESKPDSDELHLNIGNSRYKSGKMEEAIKAFDEIKSEDPSFKAKKLYNMGNVKMKQGQYGEAEKLYEESLEMGSHPDTAFNLELARKLKRQQEQKNNQNQPESQQGQDQKKDQEQQQKQQSENDTNQQSQQGKGEKRDEQESESNQMDAKAGSDGDKESRTSDPNADEISDREARKWLKILNERKAPTKVYEIPDLKNKGIREEKNAW